MRQKLPSGKIIQAKILFIQIERSEMNARDDFEETSFI